MGFDDDYEHQSPLLDGEASSSWSEESDEPVVVRTGTVWTAMAHIITGVIGAGVLSLAWSVAQLGWIAGPLAILIFAAITVVAANLLIDCYRAPHPELGPKRNRSYMEAVRLLLGDKSAAVAALFMQESLYGAGVTYTITAANSIRAIQKSNCYHRQGHQAACSYGDGVSMLMFGALQIFVSQIPDFHSMEWLSVLSAVMSFTYAFIGLGFGLAKVIENGTIKGSLGGVSTSSTASKLFLAFQALGDMACAYPFSIIVLEIQDTLKSPPSQNKTMKKAAKFATLVTTFFYLCCGCFGYAAFGNATPGNMLTGFGFYEPYWLVDFANACIVLHLVGGYQVFAQPVFAFAERGMRKKFPNNSFINQVHTLKLPFLFPVQISVLRLCFRTLYVVSTTGVAMLFPYFNQVLGLLGGLNFWPLCIYFPIRMYTAQKKIQPWSSQWLALQVFSIFCFCVAAVAFIGSIEGVISARFG
uniref:Amino acid transporter transmembrane domain-containing protein n=2 Tax=Kalanchoe fedtschenkoi TaxID=63787 RepID=A0A7N0TZL5_KALFE